MAAFRASAKKERESRFLHSFLGISGMTGKVVDANSEAPDFILDVGRRLVGVEVTEVFVGDDGGPISPKAVESIINRVIAEARQIYELKGGKPVHVSFGFTSGGEIRTLRRHSAAEALAEFLLALDPPLDQVINWKPPIRGNSLPRQLTFMNILAVPSW